jgi:hypothetical protein
MLPGQGLSKKPQETTGKQKARLFKGSGFVVQSVASQAPQECTGLSTFRFMSHNSKCYSA